MSWKLIFTIEGVPDPSDEGVVEVYGEVGNRVVMVCSIQGPSSNISWTRLQGPISRDSEMKGVRFHH